jgi:hypothetical protein
MLRKKNDFARNSLRFFGSGTAMAILTRFLRA